MAALSIRHFTDPGCPWAFSAEPQRLKLRWVFGNQLEWETRMVVLSESPADYEEKGFTPEKQARAMRQMQRRFGMPIDPRERPRMGATAPACRAVVAARRHDRALSEALLRRLRVRTMAGELLDEPATVSGAGADAGLDPSVLDRWLKEPEVDAELAEDKALARDPAPAALALDHKLAPSEDGGRRYTCPSLEIRTPEGELLVAPGYQPFESYDVSLANLAPELERRPLPESVEEALAWAGEPLATAEVAALCGLEPPAAREALARVASERPVGADGWWSLAEAPSLRSAA